MNSLLEDARGGWCSSAARRPRAAGGPDSAGAHRRERPATAVGWCAKSSITVIPARLADHLLAAADAAELVPSAAALLEADARGTSA